MAVAYKILGQSSPGAATSTTLYTVPASTQVVLSGVWICNRSAVPTSFRLSFDPNGAGDSDPDYIAYDLPIEGNETIRMAEGVTLDASDLIRVYATLATLSFSAFGQELT